MALFLLPLSWFRPQFFYYCDYCDGLLIGPNVSKLIPCQSLFHALTTFSDANFNMTLTGLKFFNDTPLPLPSLLPKISPVPLHVQEPFKAWPLTTSSGSFLTTYSLIPIISISPSITCIFCPWCFPHVASFTLPTNEHLIIFNTQPKKHFLNVYTPPDINWSIHRLEFHFLKSYPIFKLVLNAALSISRMTTWFFFQTGMPLRMQGCLIYSYPRTINRS